MMFKKVTKLMGIIILLFAILPITKVSAENQLEDGIYSIDYVVLHAETDSASIANDYFDKPATLYIEDGEKYIEFTLNHSKWIKELQFPINNEFEHVNIVDENVEKDLRTIQFKLDQDIDSIVEMKMHVLIEEMEPVYDHRYTIRLDFNSDAVELLEDAKERVKESIVDSDTQTDEGNSIPFIVIIIGVLVFILILIFISFKRFKRRK